MVKRRCDNGKENKTKETRKQERGREVVLCFGCVLI